MMIICIDVLHHSCCLMLSNDTRKSDVNDSCFVDNVLMYNKKQKENKEGQP